MYRQEDHERRDREPRLVARWNHAEGRLGRPEVGRRAGQHAFQSTGCIHGEHREQDGSDHRHDELERIGHDDAPQARERAVERGDEEEPQGRHPGVHVERDPEDCHHRAGDPSHDDEIDR